MKRPRDASEAGSDVGPSFKPGEDLFAVANSQSSYVLLSPRLLSYAKTLFFIGSCSASFCAASAGTFLLLYLFVSTSLAPPADRFRQDLLLDYSKPAAVAAVSFLPNTPPGAHTALKAGATMTRFITPGSRLDVWLEMQLADDDATNGDIFQVTGKLLSADHREAASVTRPCILAYRSAIVRRVRTLVTAPLALLGLWRERQTVRLQLFDSYEEQHDLPFTTFAVQLAARSGGAVVPRVYKASVHVNLRLGWLGRLLYMGRPGAWLTYVLVAVGLLALGGGCSAFIGVILLWLLSSAISAGSSKGETGTGRASADDVLSEGSAASDADSAALHENDSDTESSQGQDDSAYQAHPSGKASVKSDDAYAKPSAPAADAQLQSELRQRSQANLQQSPYGSIHDTGQGGIMLGIPVSGMHKMQ